GGLLTRWQDADYLFSSDAAHPDTRRIHESLEYLDGRATVFHSRYLSAWVSSSAAKQPPAPLGHFVLPPASLQEGEGQCPASLRYPAQRVTCIPSQHSSEGKRGSRASSQGEVPCHTLQEYPVNNMVTGYTSARDMRKYMGELHDFIPGTVGYAAYCVHRDISLRPDVKTNIPSNRQLFSAKP
uniref:Telomere repeat binding bouquet formation protein 2 n=1 Tax=Coturnix japonica TaxID=93934 RepID=A0A8C2Y5A9_COTJA